MAFSLDLSLLARQQGWRVEDPLALVVLERQLRQQQPVIVVQQAGNPQWQESLPEWAAVLPEIPARPDPARALLIISDRSLPPLLDVERLAIVRPPTLALGIACRQEITPTDLEDAWRELCRREALSPLSLMSVAASSLRKSHSALVEFTDRQRVPLLLYPEATYRRTPWPPRGKIAGTCLVSALLAAGATTPLVESRPFFGKLTLAAARRTHQISDKLK